MAKRVGFGLHSERLDAERVAKMGSEVEEEKEYSSIPSLGAGTGNCNREVHSQKERLDLQHAGCGESSASERQSLIQSSGRNEILEQRGVGVATFNEPGASSAVGTERGDANDARERGGSTQNYGGRCPLGESQALQRQDDRSLEEDSQREGESEDEHTH
jgi:hypothetical protein